MKKMFVWISQIVQLLLLAPEFSFDHFLFWNNVLLVLKNKMLNRLPFRCSSVFVSRSGAFCCPSMPPSAVAVILEINGISQEEEGRRWRLDLIYLKMLLTAEISYLSIVRWISALTEIVDRLWKATARSNSVFISVEVILCTIRKTCL